VCVAQKLILVGFLVLSPFRPGSFSQLIIGLFVALLFTVIQMQVQPYKRRADNLLATLSNCSLCAFFISAAIFRMNELTDEFDAVREQLSGEWASRRFTVSPSFLSAIMLTSLLGGLALMLTLHLIELFVPARDIFRWALDDTEVLPPVLEAGQFHTFLSHNWASGQDQARTIKSQLSSLCPGINVWLDVDNMRSKAGTSATDKESFEKLIDGVQVMVAIMTGSTRGQTEHSDYFRSVPCQHELGRAMHNGTPVVFVLETDTTHGGISLEGQRRECEACCPHILPLLDKSKVVEWHRVRTYQDISLKLILQELLQQDAAERSNDTVYLAREVTREPVRLQSLPEGAFHLYVSEHNPGAQAFAQLLSSYYDTAKGRSGAKRPIFKRKGSSLNAAGLLMTSDPEQMEWAAHFLCYLNARTHTSNDTTATFHAEIEYALKQNMHILLVHEMRMEADGAPFKVIIDDTPEDLKWDKINRAKRLYKELALMICGSADNGTAHLHVGLHMLLNAIASSRGTDHHTTLSSSLDKQASLASIKRLSSRAAADAEAGIDAAKPSNGAPGQASCMSAVAISSIDSPAQEQRIDSGSDSHPEDTKLAEDSKAQAEEERVRWGVHPGAPKPPNTPTPEEQQGLPGLLVRLGSSITGAFTPQTSSQRGEQRISAAGQPTEDSIRV